MSDTDTLFELLAAEHRRRVLLLLCQTETVEMPGELRARGGRRSSRGSRTQRQRHAKQSQSGAVQRKSSAEREAARALELQLTHSHLPKLEDEGLVEWNRDAQTVTRGPAFEEIEPVLHALAVNADKFPDGLF